MDDAPDSSGCGCARLQAVTKGSAYMNVFMYVIREMEDAIDDCTSGCTDCNDDPVHAWDEAVAFYTGSAEGTDGASDGYLLHALADKRCADFKTCGAAGRLAAGSSKVNIEIGEQFNIGQHWLLTGQCSSMREVVDRIVALMSVPLIQGTLRYAWKTEFGNSSTKEWAEAATFAASVLPRVAQCSASAAAAIDSKTKLGAGAADFNLVKDSFEAQYACMGITCADVGGLLDTSASALTYYPGAVPCVDSAAGSGEETEQAEIAGYQPASVVTDHNAIDQDQMAIELELEADPADFSTARDIYTRGGNSKSYADFTVAALSSNVSAGTAVAGVSATGEVVTGEVKADAAAGATTLQVTYTTSSTQATHVMCRVGGLPRALRERSGCFSSTAPLDVGGVAVSPSALTNEAGRTLQGFSTSAKAKMHDCAGGCPYRDYMQFVDYYGDFDYADKWVTGALEGAKVSFGSGAEVDFSVHSDDDTRREVRRAGSAPWPRWPP